MNKDNYIPHPIDTKDVVLPEKLITLAEIIAKNVHEVWSEGRMKDGWKYGEERNDAAKLSERDITNLVNRTKDDYSRTGMLGPKTYKTNSGYRFGIGGKYGQNKPQWQNAGRTRGYRI